MYYQVRGTNLRLLGTIHLLPPDTKEIPQWANDAVDWCQDLIVESDPNETLPHLVIKDAALLENRMPKELFGELKDAWGDAPAPFPVNSLKPWAAIFGLPLRHFRHSPGIEPRFRQRCDGIDRKVFTLESGAALARPLDEIPDEKYWKILAFLLVRIPEMETLLQSLIACWLRADLDGIASIVSAMHIYQFPWLREILLVKRNRSWMGSIKLAAKAQRRTLVAVGCLHLIGDESLPDLIRKEGHVLVPLPTS